ncbi:HesA/MoeB/ThiF family protein [Taylorella equigenitalis]|uniref:HesA/MoeB/ThiF family protein n=2 Tax=Taylorella equigenitalis TaxID=29575 RepID=UPI00240DC772|nr:HesA/MoeB/ThiF family protein [Taylorella equigenitalis]WFE05846.1 HesA/MoeB/ThiF family protein [Taylorella equigenitalis]WFE11762.1 HesA/MoeB/ThiF family protein [Taylorella equigenitalis]WGQ23814.1 HesA/MoeB/ThiF family protein [Taylorella equigenitalis]WGQ26773.1 HesA/MoeB/ThiF family protein [Taylorella equigenitalis]
MVQSLNDEQMLRYSRHIMLNNFGFEGQEKLSNARIAIIGLGGLGSAASIYLAASGVGELILVDDDVVDITNLQRQIVHNECEVGFKKVVSAKESLTKLNSEIKITQIGKKFTPNLLQGAIDAVLDCTDNFATRHDINRYCVQNKIPLVSAAAIEWSGQITTFDLRDATSPCYACLYAPEDEAPCESCATLGVISPLLGVMGSMQALEAIKLILDCGHSDVVDQNGNLALGPDQAQDCGQFDSHECCQGDELVKNDDVNHDVSQNQDQAIKTLKGRLLRFDAFTSTWSKFDLKRNTECSICSR